jgi:hypothetical protein
MQTGIPETERERVRALRKRIADRIEADLALLDMLTGDADLEDENEHGGDVQDEPHDEEEDDDRDSGCGDPAGAFEQYGGPVGAWGAFT